MDGFLVRMHLHDTSTFTHPTFTGRDSELAQGLSRHYPNLTPGFWSTFVDQMALEIKQRLHLHEEWMTKLYDKQQETITPPQDASPSKQELA